jgi:PAS domain S-box-containing protein
MPTESRTEGILLAENAELQAQLEEAKEMLRAIRRGEVDALVIESSAGPRIYALQGMDAASNRFRGEILAQVSDAVIAVDRDQRVTYVNAAAERQYGVSACSVLGRTLSNVYKSRWLQPGAEGAATTALRKRGEWRGENVHIRQDGRELNVESSVTVLQETVGQPAGSLAIIRDISARKRADDKLRVSEVRYRRIFEAAQDGVLLVDPDTCKITDANPYMTQLLGYSHDQLVGKELFEIGLLRDEDASQEMFRKLQSNHQVRYEDLPLESQAGQHQEVEVVANLYDEDGVAVIQCNIRDITERKRAEEHKKLLMAEVNHRAMNLLAVVQAVARQTARGGDPATFVARLSERIHGLAASQDLLVANQWHGVKVSDLVEAQLDHFKDLIGTRVLIDGPSSRLTAAAAQGIGMALHELATNAGKYGALSNDEGRVHISWKVSASNKPMFLMAWLEEGGPKFAPPSRKGFGQMVIGRMVEAAVNGTAQIDFRASGLSWNLSAPVADTLERRGRVESSANGASG